MKKKTRRALRRAVKAVSAAAAMIAVETIGSAAGSLLRDALKRKRRDR
ncbi:uncharacterized protein SOCE26_057010 [Sorangium cellulosum]|uniref:Secreted protein n=1 Tax=Sorangium cellulosum TaxID=56 RepID=A0A2L0EY54_SORCE|nr:hypothetical protein [Sorangium cellulosum]AUX44237.1 uncharacterized protein SOCE26_057010 [Sorangium cellulosum]